MTLDAGNAFSRLFLLFFVGSFTFAWVWHYFRQHLSFHIYSSHQASTYSISMPKPCRSLLFMTRHRNPLPTSFAAPLPQLRITLTPPHLPRLCKRLSRRRGNPMHKTLIIPKRTRLQNQPFSRFANPAPALTFFAMTTDPPRCVEIGVETELLFVRDEI